MPLWTNYYNGQATAITVDPGDNVYVTGYSTAIKSGTDYTTIKYSAVPPAPLLITSIGLEGTNLTLGGTGGKAV